MSIWKRIALLAVVLPTSIAAQPALERIEANDNRIPAGSLKNGVLTLTLEVRSGRWYPEANDGPSVPIFAFAESGKPASTPGPLIRVVEGTEIHLTLRNKLDSLPARILGLTTRPAKDDSGVVVPAKSSTTIRFKAGAPGTYYYYGTTADHSLDERTAGDDQLSGAFIIDSKSAPKKPNDRVFVLGLWFEEASSVNGVERPEREVFVINGKSWPHTERFSFTVGDTVRWRWVNPTSSTHPMHLHGFYYNVESRGAMNADTLYAPPDVRLVNTELMRIGGTMSMTWVPQKPGNWVFHCHFAFHVSEDASLEPPVSDTSHSHADMPHRMAGLVLGMHVAPRPGDTYTQAVTQRRTLRLLLQASPKRFGNEPAYGFVLQDGANIPKVDSVVIPGPTLLLKRGEPVRIVVVNNMKSSSAIHWHGIELESFPDGVPNWSGMGSKLMPPIAPKDSFVAEFTPPRSGTFMYHSHLNEATQINSGMYGALIVMDDPDKFDREKDLLIVAGGGGTTPTGADTPGLVNGSKFPYPLFMETGNTYRLRLINIHPDWRVEFALGTDTTVAKWRPVAKDGADLPESQTAIRHAYLLTGPGETADFLFTPTEPGHLKLQVRTQLAGWTIPVDVFIREPKRAGAAAH